MPRHKITDKERGHRAPLSKNEKTAPYTVRVLESVEKILISMGRHTVRDYLNYVAELWVKGCGGKMDSKHCLMFNDVRNTLKVKKLQTLIIENAGRAIIGSTFDCFGVMIFIGEKSDCVLQSELFKKELEEKYGKITIEVCDD